MVSQDYKKATYEEIMKENKRFTNITRIAILALACGSAAVLGTYFFPRESQYITIERLEDRDSSPGLDTLIIKEPKVERAFQVRKRDNMYILEEKK